MTPNFKIVHGFLEAQDSNWAKLHDFGNALRGFYPGGLVTEHKQVDFDKEPPTMKGSGPVTMIGNSWGGSAIMRWADKNPGQFIDLAILIDPVTNPINEPKQYAEKEWVRRPNIGQILLLRETASALKGVGFRPGNLELFNGQRDDAMACYIYKYGKVDEYVFDNDPKQPIDFLEHFEILKRPGVQELMIQTIASAVTNWKAA